MLKTLKEENTNICTLKVWQNISLIVLISSTSHVVFVSTFFYYTLSISSTLSKVLGTFPRGVTHTFIPEGSVPFLMLFGLGCYSFPLTLIVGHGSTKRHQRSF